MNSVAPVWEKLNELHHSLSYDFKERYRTMTWETRKKKLLERSIELHIEGVYNLPENELIGYCICSIEKADPKSGEIDSIYIDEAYRKSGLGRQLMNNAIAWFSVKGVETQKLMVACGNEQVFDFYRQFGFKPLFTGFQKIS